MPEYHVKIAGFDTKVRTFQSIRAPKGITIRGNNEKEYNWLVKGGEGMTGKDIYWTGSIYGGGAERGEEEKGGEGRRGEARGEGKESERRRGGRGYILTRKLEGTSDPIRTFHSFFHLLLQKAF